MKIDLMPADGGVLIVGDTKELADLVETLIEAMRDGESFGHLLTDDGIEDLVVRCRKSNV